MARGPSNFDAEIKKGMTGPAAKKSDGGVPSKAPPSSGKFNQPTKSVEPDDATESTAEAMREAGQAHMDAIHAHISSMRGR